MNAQVAYVDWYQKGRRQTYRTPPGNKSDANLRKALARINELAVKALDEIPTGSQAGDSQGPVRVGHTRPMSARPAAVVASAAGNAGLSGPEQRILDAIAWMESIGVDQPAQAAVAFLAGYSGPSNSAYKNPRAALKTAGLVQYLQDASRIALTDAGRAQATQPDKVATGDELHRRILAKLGGPEQRILQPLLDRYPAGVSNAELAIAAGYSDESNSAYKNPRARLRTFGLVEYREGGVRAVDFLFPEKTHER